MKIRISLMAIIIASIFSHQAIASEAREKIYLTQMINQLDALKPLMLAADNEQAKDVRVKFHYQSYRDSNGNIHNGLIEDINEIKRGIQEKLNQTMNEPRHFQAIKGDYFDLKNVKSDLVGNAPEIHNAK